MIEKEVGLHTIRQLTPEDLPRCREIALACLNQVGGVNEAMRDILRERGKSERFYTYLQEMYTVVYEEDGRVLGLGSLTESEIKRMYTDPASQGQGVGTAIITTLEEEARRRGVQEVTAQAYTSAEGFYLRAGFRRVRPDVITHGEARQEFVHMAKDIR